MKENRAKHQGWRLFYTVDVTSLEPTHRIKKRKTRMIYICHFYRCILHFSYCVFLMQSQIAENVILCFVHNIINAVRVKSFKFHWRNKHNWIDALLSFKPH